MFWKMGSKMYFYTYSIFLRAFSSFHLKLGAVIWCRNQLPNIKRGKTQSCIPLSKSSGQALATYIRRQLHPRENLKLNIAFDFIFAYYGCTNLEVSFIYYGFQNMESHFCILFKLPDSYIQK